jgi:hypothetical protein
MNKTSIVFLTLFIVSLGVHAKGGSSGHASGGSHSVSGHITKSGTYVAPHRATNPDKSKTNNWSQKGNSNPYTGKEGTKN